MKALLYFHTLRHLRWVQIWGRLRFKLQRPRPQLQAPPPSRAMVGTWQAPCERPVSMLGPATFRFLNVVHTITGAAAWNDSAQEKLWLYNLHYFDDLTAYGANERRDWHGQLIERWIDDNAPGLGNGWEPYPLSLRIVNWIKWALGGGTLSDRAQASLAVQVRFLSQRLEWHLLGNHLLANAKALVFAGLFFAQEEAEHWLSDGLAILQREWPEQILADGGHFERSPMYHSIILEDVLDLENLLTAYGETVVFPIERINSMRDWLLTMCHPDGEISFFNDAACGIASPPQALEAYAQRLQYPPAKPLTVPLLPLATSGYLRLQNAQALVLVDVAPVGPDYLPGHAHADTLSFELSVYGHRWLVNSGTSCYGTGAQRQQQRSTRAHNTVLIDGQDSSEMWGGFRVARRAYIHDLQTRENGQELTVQATHDGYRRLPGRNRHQRRWVLGPSSLAVHDEVTGPFAHAEARFHLHPDVQIQHCTAQQAILRSQDGHTMEIRVDGASLHVEPTQWHPYFGVSVPNTCLVAVLDHAQISTLIQWKSAP